MSYCQYVKNISSEKDYRVHKQYHDEQYGFPVEDDNELFGRLLLEINQAGLSWTTILHKQENFRKAYEQYAIEKIARYDEENFYRLMNDAGIIRNRLKIKAAIENARRIVLLQKEYGSFYSWLQYNQNSHKAEWVKIFKKTFVFTGGEIVTEFLKSIGLLAGAHDKDCEIYKILHPSIAD